MINDELIASNPWKFVGIEVEYTDIIAQANNDFLNFLNSHGFTITHDASVESPAETFNCLPIKGKTLNSKVNSALINRQTIGGEIVSRRINTGTFSWILPFAGVFAYLKNSGERSNTQRGSIHVHVNFPKDKDRGFSTGLLRRAWILAGYFESAFFRIGSFGREHRGDVMDFIYYRPITEKGPPVVMSVNSYRPLLVYDEVLGSTSSREFSIRCGDIYSAENRYHPSRYLWINFYNLFHASKPHIEFRVFNKVLRWDYLYAVVELCKAFVKTCYMQKTDTVEKLTKLKLNPLGVPVEDSVGYFDDLINFLNIEDESLVEVLANIWRKSDYPEYANYSVYSHLNHRARLFTNDKFTPYFPRPLTDKEILKVRNPKFIDIHRLNDLGEFIFPEE